MQSMIMQALTYDEHKCMYESNIYKLWRNDPDAFARLLAYRRAIRAGFYNDNIPTSEN